MNLQLPLFDPPVEKDCLLDRLMGSMGMDEIRDFAGWCRDGNQDMCAAVIWRHFNCSKTQARDLLRRVAELV